MTELDRFERSLEAAFQAFADRGVTPVDAVEFTSRVAAVPRRRAWLGWPQARARLATVPQLVWILLLAGLLLALVAAGLIAGAAHHDRAIVIAPSSSPIATTIAGEATILGTTKAHPLPAEGTCPVGSNPDVPGPANQERPSVSDQFGPMAFDRHAGRIVLTADDGTWTYDVCTNVWRRMSPAQEPRSTSSEQVDWLVYDADSDRTVAFTSSGQFWSYDLSADRWTKAGRFPEIRRGWGWGSWRTGAVYHDPSGLLVIYDGATIWAYDVEAGMLTEIRQRPDPSRPPGAGIPADTRAVVDPSAHYDGSGGDFIGYDRRSDLLVALVRPARPGGPSTPRPSDQTWTLDPGSGTWRLEASASTPAVGYLGMAAGPAAYDEISGLTLFRDALSLSAFDGGQRAWRGEPFVAGTLDGVSWCARSFSSPVYDSLNGRVICLGGESYRGEGPEDTSGVSALSTASGGWRWLLEPLPIASPAP